jgi:hypothetical protein
MTSIEHPQCVPTEDLPTYFASRGIAYEDVGALSLGFGHGRPQYRLYSYPAPAIDETMGVFCEWHTEDFFAINTGPHFAIGMRGPSQDDPHRGRGLAIGILSNQTSHADNPNQPVPLFRGCPDPPGGPACFIEDFTGNDGVAPARNWQLSLGQKLPLLCGNGIYRLDIHVSHSHVWAGVWKVSIQPDTENKPTRNYTFLAQTACPDNTPGFGNSPRTALLDQGRGNAFIGSAFADPQTRSWVDNIYIAHWKTQGAGLQQATA